MRGAVRRPVIVTPGQSEAQALVARLVHALGKEKAHRALDLALANFSNVEKAALACTWSFWAREKQKAPPGSWRTWGFLTGRGFGKTLSVSKHLNEEVDAGRARLLCLMAQDEASSVAIQVLGPSGLIATAPPWNKPEWLASALELVWPNGARAYVRTPEVPGKIRGLEYHLGWATEIQSWPVATREEAFSNLRLSVRLGYARIVWDATPKRRHPLLKDLLADAERDPLRHAIVRGTTLENAANLGDGYVAELERKYGGTQKGREELLGEMLEESETAIFKQAWIDTARRRAPERYARKAIGVDPAVTSRAGSDRTGIILGGLGADGQGYVLADRTGKHDAPTWAAIVLDLYVGDYCDVVVVETNKGGNLLTQNLRAAARERGLRVELVDDKWTPHRASGVVFVREVFSRGPKEDRAQPLATAYERHRVSHVIGSEDLSALEETLTTWEPTPGQRSPDGLDALVHVMGELLGITITKPDVAVGFVGLQAAAAALASSVAPRGGASPVTPPTIARGVSIALPRGAGARI